MSTLHPLKPFNRYPIALKISSGLSKVSCVILCDPTWCSKTLPSRAGSLLSLNLHPLFLQLLLLPPLVLPSLFPSLSSLHGWLPLILREFVSGQIPPPRRGHPATTYKEGLPQQLAPGLSNSIIPPCYSPEFFHSTYHCLTSLFCPFIYLLVYGLFISSNNKTNCGEQELCFGRAVSPIAWQKVAAQEKYVE